MDNCRIEEVRGGKMMNNNILRNKRIHLGGFMEEDLPAMIAWYDNEQMMRYLDALPFRPKSKSDVRKWTEETSDKIYRFSIRLNETNEIIGYIELDGILWTHRTTWISIAIGDDQYWGAGYGAEALQCMLSYAFQELNLHRVQLTVFSYNQRAISLYQSLGFQKEGEFREFLQRDGQRYGMELYGLLYEEWKESIQMSI
ncbi:GNAT family N-acetyltransferase [Bacillus sp. 2205SS5-2]|uniref:GNAT family N-acetyltransferase n=1 Tax=Bacillus sp. 2205SS5-2 TaxID=3109031 RepID=UPI0030050876